MSCLVPRRRRAAPLRSLLLAAGLAACSDPTGTVAPVTPDALAAAQERGTVGREVPASVEWNLIARQRVAANRSSVFIAFRTYALVSLAQAEALDAADRASRRGRRVSGRAAVAAASAAVLREVYQGDSTTLEGLVRQQLASADWLERGEVDAVFGEAVGRAVGAGVAAFAKSDRYFEPWTGEVPTGDGVWYSATTPPSTPLGAAIATARTWFLATPDQFRPPPPPAFGSPQFLAALAEVRQVSDTRTAQQDSIARFWAFGAGTYTPPGYWNEQACALVLQHRLDERRAARLLAVLNMVAVDAIIASNDAKYEYWVLRPSQADPGITLSLPLPNFPAYPSNHAAISSAMAEVIAAAFPREARRLRAGAEEAALSRVYGGIHYRFDGDAGLELGRRVARWGLLVAGREHGRFPRFPWHDR